LDGKSAIALQRTSRKKKNLAGKAQRQQRRGKEKREKGACKAQPGGDQKSSGVEQATTAKPAGPFNEKKKTGVRERWPEKTVNNRSQAKESGGAGNLPLKSRKTLPK